MEYHPDAPNGVLVRALCPNEECGSVVTAYRLQDSFTLCDFVCPRCGMEFSLPKDQLEIQPILEASET